MDMDARRTPAISGVWINRRNGGEQRIIRAPIKPLKDFQHQILPLLELAYQPRPHVHGFVRGRSPITNAAIHRGQRWILRIDLRDFFPSINFGRVRGMFRAYPFEYPEDVATLLAQICCHRNELPQGAPTSPLVSNLICRRLDKELASFGAAVHCHYTRYADDICLSSGRRAFPGQVATRINDKPVLAPELRQIVVDNGFVVNDDKTRLMPRRQRQRVTGLVVNTSVNVPREYRRHLRAVLHIWSRYGEEDAESAFKRANPNRNWPPEKPPAEFRLIIRGQLQHLGAVRGYDRVYQQLAKLLTACDPSFTPTAPAIPRQGEIVFATEGPSDPLHLEAALRELRTGGAFRELDLRAVSHQPPKNDEQLWRWLNRQAEVPNRIPHLGLFDHDSDYASQIGESGWSHLGNGVVAVALAPAPWLGETKNFCIEMLYPRDILRREDADGRRLFLRDEFDEEGVSRDGRFRMAHPRSKTLVVAKVHPVDDPTVSVGLAKVAFADAIWRRQAPYESVDFSGFEPTLRRIWKAVATAQQWCAV